MNSKSKIFEVAINTIENNDMKEFANKFLEIVPDYFWNVGASSTNKYHPNYALGDLGLARHSLAVVRFLNHIFNIESMNKFTSRERDCLRIAALFHDSFKSGDQEAYEKNKYTKHEHPILAANKIRSLASNNIISGEEIELIATTIESHMGEWNTSNRSSVILPKPTNKYQNIIHMCDYLASRKDIELIFSENEKSNEEIPNLEDYKLTFGKYKGSKLTDVIIADPSYVEWLKSNTYSEPLKTLLKNTKV